MADQYAHLTAEEREWLKLAKDGVQEPTLRSFDLLLSRVTPGRWEEDRLLQNDDGRSYRYSQIIAPDPRDASKSITVCDTLNAHFLFDEDERRDHLELLAMARNELADLIREIHASRTAVPQLLAEVSRLRGALTVIRDMPLAEQDNMIGSNMRQIARAALNPPPGGKKE